MTGKLLQYRYEISKKAFFLLLWNSLIPQFYSLGGPTPVPNKGYSASGIIRIIHSPVGAPYSVLLLLTIY